MTCPHCFEMMTPKIFSPYFSRVDLRAFLETLLLARCVYGHTYKNSHKITLATRKEKRSPLQADNCPWKMTVSCTKKTDGKLKVNKIDNVHNHGLAADPLYHHQHRRLLKEAGAGLATALQATTARDGQRLVTERDLYNLRAKLDLGSKNCVADLSTASPRQSHVLQDILLKIKKD